MSKRKWIIIIFFVLFIYEILEFKKTSYFLINHVLNINLLSWMDFWLLTLFSILIILPLQLKISIIVEKIQKINKIFLEENSKDSTKVLEILKEANLPSKDKIMFILFLNVILFGYILSILSYFNLYISSWLYTPIAILFLYFSTQTLYNLFINKIKNYLFNFVTSLCLSIFLLNILHKESLIFILCQSIILKIVIKYYFYKRNTNT